MKKPATLEFFFHKKRADGSIRLTNPCKECRSTEYTEAKKSGSEKHQRRLASNRKAYHADIDKSRAYHRDYEQMRRQDPNWSKNNNLKANYGITLDDYNAMLEEQGGVCAIPGCGRDGSDRRGGLTVDHDHKTGRVRGLLCHQCNAAIGLLAEDPVRVAGVIEFLLEHSDN